MYGFPRSQFYVPPQYGRGQTIPFHTGLYGASVRPPMPPHSYFERATNKVPIAVQGYLDINSNKSCGESQEMVKHDESFFESPFRCEPCKKSFQDKNSLTVHLKTHVKCEFPNCVFVASRQTLKLHEIQCHREGKMKIVLDTPEQIAKWREERKRNYPTVKNVTRKEAEKRQKIESGDILTTKEFRYNRKQGWKQQRGKNKRGRNGAQQRDNAASTQSGNVALPAVDLLPEKQSEKSTLQDEKCLGLKRNDIKCEDTAGSLLNLASLAADYATSSSDEDGNIDNTVEQKGVTEKSAQSEHSSKPEKKRQRLIGNVDKQSQRKNSQARSRKKHTQPQNTTGSNRSRPTLLEMLLASDIRHERNVMLQCIRFIVRKRFFGIE